jgi:hypothetical protein
MGVNTGGRTRGLPPLRRCARRAAPAPSSPPRSLASPPKPVFARSAERGPPEAVQRIVRQNFGRFRACYDDGLKRNPALAGRVTTRFVIGRSGAVSSVGDGGSDLPDAAVKSCMQRAFQSISFPEPEGGIVTVVYPIVFSSADST